MARKRVTVDNDPGNPLYRMTCVLDGVKYLLDWDYNGRQDRLFFDLSTADGTAIVRGIKLVPGIPLLYKVKNPLAPPGILTAQAFSDDDAPPGLQDLGIGKRVVLYYLPGV